MFKSIWQMIFGVAKTELGNNALEAIDKKLVVKNNDKIDVAGEVVGKQCFAVYHRATCEALHHTVVLYH